MDNVKINILVTRPVSISSAFSTKVGQLYNIIDCPLLRIEPIFSKYDNMDEYEGLVFTSKNAALYFNYNMDMNVKIFAIGNSTAEELSKKGYNNIIIGSSNALALGKIIVNNIRNKAKLLHIRGDHIAGDLKGYLSDSDILLEPLIIYKSIQIDFLDQSLINIIKDQQLDFITLYSPRAGEAFKNLVRKYKLDQYMKNIKCLCLSEMVLNSVKEIEWNSSYISKNCNEESMIRLVRDLT